MNPASEADVQRALAELDNAPRSEHGIIIPPAVAAQQEIDRATAAQPVALPNRKQRRANAKHARRQAKRLARLSDRQRETQAQIKEAIGEMSETEMLATMAALKERRGEYFEVEKIEGSDAA